MTQDHRTTDERIRDVSTTVDYSGKILSQWDSAFRILPRVDEQGRSDCPFAERLYANKEEAEQELIKRIEELRELESIIAQEMARSQQNASLISSDAGRLHSERPREQYEQARRGAEAEYHRLAEKRESVLARIAELEEALRRSQTKKWPLGEPKNTGGVRGGGIG